MTTIFVVELLNSNKDDYNFVSIHQDFSEAIAKAKRFGAVVSQWEVLNHRVKFVTMYNSEGEVIQCS